MGQLITHKPICCAQDIGENGYIRHTQRLVPEAGISAMDK